MISAELQELVDAPNETLGVEYKAWLDLTSLEVRADVARHIAAIANHGGGYIVFGFDDSTLEYVPSPFAEKIDRDEPVRWAFGTRPGGRMSRLFFCSRN